MLNQQDPSRTICKGTRCDTFCLTANSASLALQSTLNFICICAEAAHQFSPQANDWGFTAFASHQEVYARGAGFVVDDTLRMNVVVRVDRPEDMYYDSKKSTGYVGLKNQGATCYMNSLLQTLYNINYFRQVKSPLCCGIVIDTA